MATAPNKCGKCDTTVYATEEIKCLDKVWHKGCLKCTSCGITLNIKTFKGYDKMPYCNVHYPQSKSPAGPHNPPIPPIVSPLEDAGKRKESASEISAQDNRQDPNAPESTKDPVPRNGGPNHALNDNQKRQLCPDANKGICRLQDNECKYCHTRCQNYDSCSQADCLLAHAPQSSSGPNNPKPCLNGIQCYKPDCKFKHPEGWSACNGGERCINYDCISTHPPGRPKPCRHGNRCNRSDCRFLHSNDYTENWPKGEIKIWIQFDGCQTTTVTLNCTSTIEDLKRVALNGQERINLYQAYYRNQELGPGKRVPLDTDDNQPVLLRKIPKPQPTGPGIGPIMDPVIPQLTTPTEYSPRDFHIFIDYSNVFIGSKSIYNEETRSSRTNPAIRVNVNNLANVLEANKLQIEIKTHIVGGSSALKDDESVWKEWESCGYKCIVAYRQVNGKEVFVDDMLHAQILNTLLAYNHTPTRPQVLVLVTGDGNRNSGNTSFPIVVERVLTSGWSVELWSWQQSLSSRFFEIQKQFPTRMTIKYLDSYRAKITFK